MGSFSGKFVSARQDWTTPDDIFDPLQKEFSFTLDAAASFENKRATLYFSADDDGLSKDWGSERVWVNPPYGEGKSRLSNWVSKAFEASRSGATCVMLIPARTNTKWFHDFCIKHGEVRFLKGRPKFGGAKHGLPQPLCVVIFRPNPIYVSAFSFAKSLLLFDTNWLDIEQVDRFHRLRRQFWIFSQSGELGYKSGDDPERLLRELESTFGKLPEYIHG